MRHEPRRLPLLLLALKPHSRVASNALLMTRRDERLHHEWHRRRNGNKVDEAVERFLRSFNSLVSANQNAHQLAFATSLRFIPFQEAFRF